VTIQLNGKLVCTVKVPSGDAEDASKVLDALRQEDQGNKKVSTLVEQKDIKSFKRVVVVKGKNVINFVL
jgi:hypothetical protein